METLINCLILRTVIYPCKYTDSLKRFNETLLPDQIDFFGNLNMAEVTNAEYKSMGKLIKNEKMKNLVKYHVWHATALNQALNYRLILKEVHQIIQFNLKRMA